MTTPKDLKDAIAEAQRYEVLADFKGPGTAEEDENGVVYLKDAHGSTRAVMNREDFLALKDLREGGLPLRASNPPTVGDA